MADSSTRIDAPSGSPHDIAMMAYQIARRAMDHIERHEKECYDWRKEQRGAMEALRSTALANFTVAAEDRADFRKKLDQMEERAASFILRTGAYIIVALVGGLSGVVWWLISHPH